MFTRYKHALLYMIPTKYGDYIKYEDMKLFLEISNNDKETIKSLKERLKIEKQLRKELMKKIRSML